MPSNPGSYDARVVAVFNLDLAFERIDHIEYTVVCFRDLITAPAVNWSIGKLVESAPSTRQEYLASCNVG